MVASPPITLYRNADWLEEVRFETDDAEGYDMTGCVVSATLRNQIDHSLTITASNANDTIEIPDLTGPSVSFIIKVESEDFRAACPAGDYDYEFKLSLNGDDVVVLRSIRHVREGLS